MSSSRNSTWPAVTGNRPQTRLTTVDLPEPLGPIRPNTSPLGTLEVEAVDGADAAEMFTQPLEFEHCPAPCC